MRAGVRLTRLERVLAVLAVLALVIAAAAVFYRSQQAEAREELASEVRSERAGLERAREQADLAPLREERDRLRAGLEEAGPVRAGAEEVTLDLWRWASSSRVTLTGLEYRAGEETVGENSVKTHGYRLTVSGAPEDIHGFLTTVTGSRYHPQVRAMSVGGSDNPAGWLLDLEIVVPSREISLLGEGEGGGGGEEGGST